MDGCIFCRISSEDIPSYKVYEDERVFAFLDINPATRGHMLVIPKEHHADLMDLDEELISHIATISKRLADRAVSALGAAGFNLHSNSGVVAQQDVFHFHMHVIPRYSDDGMKFGGPVGTPKPIDMEQVHKELTA